MTHVSKPSLELEYDVTFGDGKYRITYDKAYRGVAYRHGEPWPARTISAVGDKMLLCLVQEFTELQEALTKAKEALLGVETACELTDHQDPDIPS